MDTAFFRSHFKARSLSARLIVTLGLLISLFAVLQGASSYHLAQRGVDALLDARLSQVASRVRDVFSDAIPRNPTRGSQNSQDLVILIWKGDDALPTRSTEPTVLFDRNAAPGFTNPLVNDQRWRLYTLPSADKIVQVAQLQSVRQRLAGESVISALLPILVLIPAVWLAIIIVVRRTFRELNELGDTVQAIDPAHLTPLPAAGLAIELQPFVSSFNGMIERLVDSIETERKFISDAAHELRTPLTALQLQADNLQQDIFPSNQERFRELQRGIERNCALLVQLLRLARADAQLLSSELTWVDVPQVMTDVVSEVLPIANARNIDIGANEVADSKVHAIEADVRIVVKNLVGNAVRYTQDGGTIDLRIWVQAQTVGIEVVDNGPGIPEALLPRIFDRFFRANPSIEGSGLGLSIVKAIANRYGGEIRVVNRADGHSGIVATAIFPLGVPPAAASATSTDASSSLQERRV